MPHTRLDHAAAALGALLGVAGPANAQTPGRAASDYSYDFQLTEHRDGAGKSGTVRVHGDRTRMNVVMASETALAQTDADFVRRAAAMRATVLHGAPPRTVVTSSEVERDADRRPAGAVQWLEITRLTVGPQPASLFDVPAGYVTTTSRARLDRW